LGNATLENENAFTVVEGTIRHCFYAIRPAVVVGATLPSPPKETKSVDKFNTPAAGDISGQAKNLALDIVNKSKVDAKFIKSYKPTIVVPII